MKREFILPDLGSGLKEAEIVSWLVNPGDKVTTGSPLCEVETEKAAIEIPVPYDGVLASLAAEEGGKVNVGELLAVFEVEGEAAVETQPVAVEKKEDAEAPIAVETPDQESNGEDGDGQDAIRHRAMPSIRRMAREYAVDLSKINGTGPHGRITRADVQAVVDQQPPTEPSARPEAEEVPPPRAEEIPKEAPAPRPAAPPPAAEENSPKPSAQPAAEGIRLSKLRRTIAYNLSRSWHEIPHVFTRMEIDATQFIQAREILAARFDQRIPVEFLLIRAVLPALKEFPEFNATLEDDQLVLHDHYDIGTAVDTDQGLVIAVLHSADEVEVADLAERLTILMKRASLREASPAELTGATFTVNNIGALGGIMGTSIIPYGTTAILSTGRIAEKAVVRSGQIVAAPMMEVTLSFDHRVIDGGLAQRFMNGIKENLEQPLRFLL